MIRTANLIHPGEILLEEFLKPMGISQNKLAMDIGVPTPRINAIVRGTRAITADTALRLGKYFGTGPEFWCNLQSNYDLCLAATLVGSDIDAIPVRIRHPRPRRGRSAESAKHTSSGQARCKRAT